MRDRVKEGQAWFLLIVVGWMVLMLCGCKQVEYVPVHIETRDSIYLTKMVRDSVFVEVIKDEKAVKGKNGENDTVYVTETIYKYKEKVVADTAYIERVDSVEVPYPVEKKLSKWEQTCVNYGGEALVFSFVLFFVIVWLICKRIF